MNVGMSIRPSICLCGICVINIAFSKNEMLAPTLTKTLEVNPKVLQTGGHAFNITKTENIYVLKSKKRR